MFDIEKEFTVWLNTFRHCRHFFREDIEELERHVRDSTAGFVNRGFTEQEAFERSIQNIGDYGQAEKEYRKVYWQKVRYRGSFVQNLMDDMSMFNTYMKLAGRNLMKHKLASIINLVGFSTAIGCCLVLFSFIDIQFDVDTFHEFADEIFLVQNIIVDSDGKEIMEGRTPVPLGPALLADLPQIEHVVRFARGNTRMIYEDKNFNESLFFVDPAVFEVFTYPLKHGDKRALSERNAIVFSNKMAEKYFGRKNPVGEQLTLSFGENYTDVFTVTGVLEEIPNNRSWETNFFIPYEIQSSLGIKESDWHESTAATFIQLINPESVETVAAQLDRYVARHNAENIEIPVEAFFLDNLQKLSLHSHRVRNSLAGGSSPESNIALGAIGVLLLLLAAFNYVNIAIASATRRFKEIGIRKVVGSTNTQLIRQFLIENMLLCVLALLGGLLLAESFLLPFFNSIFAGTGAPEFKLDYSGSIRIWIFFICLLLTIGLGSGAYPAFYISSFHPVAILRSRLKFGGKNLITRSFVTIQFVITFILVAVAVGTTQNQIYQYNRSWGYNPAHTIVVPVDGYSQYSMLHNDLSQLADIVSVAGSRSSLGRSRSLSIVTTDTTSREVISYYVGSGYLETMGLGLIAGRAFNKDRQTDMSESVMVNEAFVAETGWQSALERQVICDSVRYTVIGIVQDFQDNAFFDTIGPVVFFGTPEETYRYLSITVLPDSEIPTNEAIKRRWEALIPEMDYAGFIQKDVFEAEFGRRNREIGMFKYIGFMALVLSCMGILGLVSLSIARRKKDLSIHKVLGASSLRVAHLINKEYFILIGLALAVASPLSYYLLKAMLDAAYTDHVPIGIVPFAVSAVLMLVTLILTISSQIYKAIVSNPVDALQSE